MRYGSVTTLLLGVALAVAPTHALAAEPGEMGYVVARGGFDQPQDCSSESRPACSVHANQIVLVEDVATGRFHGAATYGERWRPDPECEPWTSTMWLEFTGEGHVASEAGGHIANQVDMEVDAVFDGTCQHTTSQFQLDDGEWRTEPLGGDQLSGWVGFPVWGTSLLRFTLDVTHQAEAPDGFFAQALILHPQLTEGLFEDDPGVSAVSPPPDQPQQNGAPTGSSGPAGPFDDATANAFFFLFHLLTDGITLNPLGAPIYEPPPDQAQQSEASDETSGQDDSDIASGEAFEIVTELIEAGFFAGGRVSEEPEP